MVLYTYYYRAIQVYLGMAAGPGWPQYGKVASVTGGLS